MSQPDQSSNAQSDAAESQQPALSGYSQSSVIIDSEDFPLGKACDLSGEGTCDSCQ